MNLDEVEKMEGKNGGKNEKKMSRFLIHVHSNPFFSVLTLA